MDLLSRFRGRFPHNIFPSLKWEYCVILGLLLEWFLDLFAEIVGKTTFSQITGFPFQREGRSQLLAAHLVLLFT